MSVLRLRAATYGSAQHRCWRPQAQPGEYCSDDTLFRPQAAGITRHPATCLERHCFVCPWLGADRRESLSAPLQLQSKARPLHCLDQAIFVVPCQLSFVSLQQPVVLIQCC